MTAMFGDGLARELLELVVHAKVPVEQVEAAGEEGEDEHDARIALLERGRGHAARLAPRSPSEHVAATQPCDPGRVSSGGVLVQGTQTLHTVS